MVAADVPARLQPDRASQRLAGPQYWQRVRDRVDLGQLPSRVLLSYMAEQETGHPGRSLASVPRAGPPYPAAGGHG